MANLPIPLHVAASTLLPPLVRDPIETGAYAIPQMPNSTFPSHRPPHQLTTIGVFYDGNYFNHVSTYYKYSHGRRARLSIAGLHRFIRAQAAGEVTDAARAAREVPGPRAHAANGRRGAREESDRMRRCQIIDAHYFRGGWRRWKRRPRTRS